MIDGHQAHRLAASVASAAGRPGAARALILDLDGTLAPIAPSPENARVPPHVLASMRALIDAGWHIAVVSGRSARQTKAMVPVPGVAIFGSHGAERLGRPLPRRFNAVRARLGRLARRAGEMAARFPRVRVERKPVGLAFHDRALARGERARWHRRLAAWLATQDLSGLQVLHGKRVIELRPAGVDKSAVVSTFPPSRGWHRFDPSLVVIGDDRTDEDLFDAVSRLAVSIRVGRKGIRSRATHRLPSPVAVARFLDALATDAGPPGAR
jgi:trehalose 6-phosphate phosphatase